MDQISRLVVVLHVPPVACSFLGESGCSACRFGGLKGWCDDRCPVKFCFVSFEPKLAFRSM